MGDTDAAEVRFAVIGDVHARFDRLDPVLEHIALAGPLDAILLVGDIGGEPPWGSRASAEEKLDIRRASIETVLERVHELGLPTLWVPGNHDPREVPLDGNVDGLSRDVAGLSVVGIGGAGPARFGFPYEWDEDEIRGLALPAWDVLISHTPPRGTALDRTHRGDHVGSVAVRERAEAQSGAIVSGHIHEAAGAEVVGGCLCLNAGGLGEPHGKAQVAYLRRDAAATWHARHLELPAGRDRSWTHAPG